MVVFLIAIVKTIQFIIYFLFVGGLLHGQNSNSVYKSYEIHLGDTINRIDKKGEKQGRWIYFGKDKKGWIHSVFKPHQVVEEGHYINDKKHKTWKTYHHTNKIKSEVTYLNDNPDGNAKFYDQDGKIVLEGTLKDQNFTDEYYLYDANGKKVSKKANSNPNSSYLDFSGKVSKMSGKDVDNVQISVFRNDLEIHSEKSDASGKFRLKLELSFEYQIRFSKQGYGEQSLLINTNTHDISDTNIYHLNEWIVSMTDNLATAATAEFFGFLLNKPSGKIYFNKRKRKFISDGSYLHLFKKEFKDISETTKLMLAKAAEDNKKLEIENLRIEAERKAKEIELLKQAQELQESELSKKEAEIKAQQLEAEKQTNEAAIMSKEKKIKELLVERQQAELHQKQLIADQQEKEYERLALIRKMQDLEINQKSKKLSEAATELTAEKKLSEVANKELDVVSREKKVKEQELHQNQMYMTFLMVGLGLVAVFTFFLIRNIQQKKKANELLARQSNEIEKQKNDIQEKSKIIEEKNIETEQSIIYAKRIQFAILPPPSEIENHLGDYFILYKPKDIVSGDFYFFSPRPSENGSDNLILAAVDCTGHGVPGAFMSLVGNEKIKDAVDVSLEPGKVLYELNNGIKAALRQSGDSNSTRDGMDISVCTLPTFHVGSPTTLLKYAGANRPLYIIRKNESELTELKATKCAIGGLTPIGQEFDQHEIELKSGDTFYLFSDGYADQFGGPNKKKLMTKKFKEILLSIRNKNMKEQQTFLDTFISGWRGDTEQVDDILVIGVRV